MGSRTQIASVFSVTVQQRSERLRARATSAGRAAGTTTQKFGGELVEAVGELADAAVDRVLLTEERVTSAAEGRRRLAGASDTEALSEQGPARRDARNADRPHRGPWRPLYAPALGDDRLELGLDRASPSVPASASSRRSPRSSPTGSSRQRGPPSDPRLVKKVAIDLYLDPKRVPDPTESKLRLVRLTRKWVLLGAFGRKTSTRAGKALDAADKLDAKELAARWGRS